MKSEGQAFVLWSKSRECFLEVYNDNRSKIIIVYLFMYLIIWLNFLFFFQNTKMDPRVVKPLSSLIEAFQGPTRLIQKRHDKQLDLQVAIL
jgi:hypothetical protein